MKTQLLAGGAVGLVAVLSILSLASIAAAMPDQAGRPQGAVAMPYQPERANIGVAMPRQALPRQAKRAEACQAVFDANRPTIERMAAFRQTRGVSRIFSANGCPAPRVSVHGGPAEAARLRCTYKFPATIICTFGLAEMAPSGRLD